MRLQDYWELVKSYLPFALLTAVAAGGLFLLGYFLLYKKILHGKKRLRAGTAVPVLLLGIYLLFLLCITLLNRTSAPTGANLTPFTSWREAWYQASPSDWRYIIFNIIAFIPLGILLPLCSGWFDRWIKILLSGFGCSLLIEVTQLITGRGLFETDDLIHNTLGTAIGYGFLCLLLMLLNRTKGKRVLRTLASQLPFLSVTVLLLGLFTYYQCKELGNLSSHYIYPVHLASDVVSIDCSLTNTPEKVFLYQTKVGSKADADQLAEEIFAQFDTEILPERTIYYDYTAVYYAQGGDKSLWVNYAGMTWTLHFYVVYDWNGSIQPTEEEARQSLQQRGIDLPADAVYTLEDDRFTFTADMSETDAERVYNGSITYHLADSGQYASIENKMMLCESVREMETISASKAAGKLAKGQFRWYGDEIGHISITGAKLGREMDSKGYYQPVWNFDTLIDGKEYTLSIPALAQ